MFRYEPLKSTREAISKVMREAGKPDQCHYEDEDEVVFTRAEIREVWAYILGTNQEISDWRSAEAERP